MKKYLIFNSATAFIVAYLVYFYDAFNYLVSADPTYVTFLILGIYTACTVYLAFGKNLKLVKFIASRLTAIGLIGTVIGIMMLFQESAHLAPDDVIEPLFKGMGTVLITTLFGIGGYLLLVFQLAFVHNELDDDG